VPGAVADIAAGAEVGKGTLYRYFRGWEYNSLQSDMNCLGKFDMESRAVAFLTVAIAWLAAPAPRATAADAPAKAPTTWYEYRRINFVIDGRPCILVVPKAPAAGQPWIWRTEFFSHQPQADQALVAKGFHLAYIDVQNMYGAPVALGHMDAFYAHVTREYGLAPKVVLEGFSRGGLFSFNWAARNPEKVACIYNDAPVCDVKSWPGSKGHGPGSKQDWLRLLKVYGLTKEQALHSSISPIDHLEPLANAKIPLLHVVGDADEVVPLDENTRVVEKRYQELGGSITVIVKPGCKHHPHSLTDPKPIVDFVLQHTGQK
jgi:pimeloyl-ACP methyl ester carboxylesterase